MILIADLIPQTGVKPNELQFKDNSSVKQH